jgi:hypothetical protein
VRDNLVISASAANPVIADFLLLCCWLPAATAKVLKTGRQQQ